MKRTSHSLLLLFLVGQGKPCPDGYTQAPNDGACYQIKVYFDNFIGQYQPKSYDSVESDCVRSGANLASINSEEETEYVYGLMSTQSRCNSENANIGLKCTGKDCSWYDGSPVSYTNFGAAPSDDRAVRCYAIAEWKNGLTWVETGNCKQPENPYSAQITSCWVCKTPIVCHDYETAYNRGCVSVYTWPLDQKNAELSCPTGGHLISVHSNNENNYYMQLALAAGIDGTMYLGGQFSDGKYEWLDGTNYDDTATKWANGFPNEILGGCVQMLLDPHFGNQGQWANVDCSVKQPYICFRNGNSPQQAPPSTPKAEERCPPIQHFNGSGSVYSPNYPISIPPQQTCEYVLEAKEGSKASVIFNKFNCQQGTSLELYDGNDDDPFITFTSSSPSPMQAYTATSNVLKLIFIANGNDDPVGTGWQAEFTGK